MQIYPLPAHTCNLCSQVPVLARNHSPYHPRATPTPVPARPVTKLNVAAPHHIAVSPLETAPDFRSIFRRAGNMCLYYFEIAVLYSAGTGFTCAARQRSGDEGDCFRDMLDGYTHA